MHNLDGHIPHPIPETIMANLDGLPPEVFGLILSYLMPTNQEVCIDRAKHCNSIGQVKRLGARLWGAEHLRSFLLANRNISAQILDVVYGSNVFTFYDPWLIETFMIRIGQTNLQRIAHVEIQAGAMTKVHNSTTTTTLFSIISSNFQNLQTLRIVGVGRGKIIGNSFDPNCWLPSHLERLEFITSLPGCLNKAKVYCDVGENNSRLLCNGVAYKKDKDEAEIDMHRARDEMKVAEKMAKKRKAAGLGPNPENLLQPNKSTKIAVDRKRPKIKPTYMWKC